ncbi:IS110 family transposase [Robinsoniella sp. RHS]|uniref:IS110 family transposase n=1 Tax=Robinsoniella sp. RHS TaxID=1504536 RepID=UPI000649458E
MEVLYKRCCGIDIHKNMLVACVFISVRKKEIRQFGTMTDDILQLTQWLKEVDCEMAAMESTGSYWKPVYNIFEEEHIPVIVVNAQHIKGVPGRKTDVKDAEWIADLVRHGLVKASFIPNREQRELRDKKSAERLLAETGIEMNQFKSQSNFSSWAGLVPECKESAGKKMSTRIRKGNQHVKSVLVECARSAIRNKKSYFYSRYQRIASRRGGKRALIAIAHSMLVAIYHILKDLQPYRELGCGYYDTCNHEKIIQRNVRSLERLGVKVVIE